MRPSMSRDAPEFDLFNLQMRYFSTMEQLILIFTSISLVYPSGCPDDWRQYENSCYNVFTYRTTFHSAIRRCAGHQGSLLSVRNPKENLFIQNIIARFLDDQFWIGIYFNQTSWFWLDDGTEVTWSRWAGPKGACALMFGPHKWVTETCGHYHQFICKKDVQLTTEAESTMGPDMTTWLPTETSHVSTTSTTSVISMTSPEVEDNNDDVGDDVETSTALVTERTREPVEPLEEDVTPEVILINRKKNPGRTHTDNRPSAIGIGSMGIGVLVFVFVGVFLLDASKLWRDFSMFRHNVSEMFRKIKKQSGNKDRERCQDKQGCTSGDSRNVSLVSL